MRARQARTQPSSRLGHRCRQTLSTGCLWRSCCSRERCSRPRRVSSSRGCRHRLRPAHRMGHPLPLLDTPRHPGASNGRRAVTIVCRSSSGNHVRVLTVSFPRSCSLMCRTDIPRSGCRKCGGCGSQRLKTLIPPGQSCCRASLQSGRDRALLPARGRHTRPQTARAPATSCSVYRSPSGR